MPQNYHSNLPTALCPRHLHSRRTDYSCRDCQDMVVGAKYQDLYTRPSTRSESPLISPRSFAPRAEEKFNTMERSTDNHVSREERSQFTFAENLTDNAEAYYATGEVDDTQHNQAAASKQATRNPAVSQPSRTTYTYSPSTKLYESNSWDENSTAVQEALALITSSANFQVDGTSVSKSTSVDNSASGSGETYTEVATRTSSLSSTEGGNADSNTEAFATSTHLLYPEGQECSFEELLYGDGYLDTYVPGVTESAQFSYPDPGLLDESSLHTFLDDITQSNLPPYPVAEPLAESAADPFLEQSRDCQSNPKPIAPDDGGPFHSDLLALDPWELPQGYDNWHLHKRFAEVHPNGEEEIKALRKQEIPTKQKPAEVRSRQNMNQRKQAIINNAAKNHGFDAGRRPQDGWTYPQLPVSASRVKPSSVPPQVTNEPKQPASGFSKIQEDAIEKEVARRLKEARIEKEVARRLALQRSSASTSPPPRSPRKRGVPEPLVSQESSRSTGKPSWTYASSEQPKKRTLEDEMAAIGVPATKRTRRAPASPASSSSLSSLSSKSPTPPRNARWVYVAPGEPRKKTLEEEIADIGIPKSTRKRKVSAVSEDDEQPRRRKLRSSSLK